MIAAKRGKKFRQLCMACSLFCRIHVDPECAISKRESYQIVDS